MGFADALWLLLFALLAAGSLRLSIQRFDHWFTPLSIFCGVNCLSLCAYHLRLLEMQDVSLATHLLVLAGLLAFVLGAVAAGRPVEGREWVWSAPAIEMRGLRAFFYLTALAAAVGWLLPASILVLRHGLAALLANIWVLQLEFQMQFIGYLNVVGVLVLPTYVLLDARTRRRLPVILLTASACLGLILAGIKSYLIYAILSAMFCWSIAAPKRFTPRVLLACLLVMLAFFVVYTQVIDVFTGDFLTDGGIFAGMKSLHRPYVYFVGPWPAMDDLLHGRVEPRGQFASITLDPLWKILGDGLKLIEPVPLALPFTNIDACMFNVYTFMGEVIFDFKWPGAIVFSWLLGFVGTRLYLRVRRPGYWAHAVVYAVVGHGIFLSSFLYGFRFVMAVLLLYVYVFGFVILRRGVLVDRRNRD